jgi:hypothetical protein
MVDAGSLDLDSLRVMAYTEVVSKAEPVLPAFMPHVFGINAGRYKFLDVGVDIIFVDLLLSGKWHHSK